MNNYFTSTIFRKVLSSLTGFFLITFLLGHLAGNLQLFIPGVEGQTQFNKYALFMTTNPIVKVLSILTYFSIVLHVIMTLYLAVQSRRARPVQYVVSSGDKNSNWSSRNMSILGICRKWYLTLPEPFALEGWSPNSQDLFYSRIIIDWECFDIIR